jgi:TATA-box binding protein (TBP) (component of TFIID and TFIIIB)
MFTLIYKSGKEMTYTGGESKSLNKLTKAVLEIAKKNKSIEAVRYNNRDRDIIWTEAMGRN